MSGLTSRAKLAVVIAAVSAGILGAFIANGLFGSFTRAIGPMEVHISVSPSFKGRTVVYLPPLGRLEADTHRAPVVLTAVVEEAKPEKLQSILLNTPGSKGIAEEVRADSKAAMIALVKRLLLLAFIGGALTAFALVPIRRLLAAGIGASAGVLVTAVMIASALIPYRADAFHDPSLHGAIKSAPWVVKLARERFEKIEDLEAEIRITARNVIRLQEQLGAISELGPPDADVRILAISDLHNNVLAMNYLGDLARLFDVHFVLNAGDLTDYGTPFENGFVREMRRLGKPQVVVAGNHDSPETVATLARLDKVLLPDEKMVEVAGIRILGQHDPASRVAGPERELTASPQELSLSAARLKRVYARQRKKPDIIMVHTPEIARHFIGSAPILVSGHVHRMSAERHGDTVWINPGSSGAAGIRYFQGSDEKAITAAILYVNRKPGVSVIAADLISITSPTGEFTVQRKKF